MSRQQLRTLMILAIWIIEILFTLGAVALWLKGDGGSASALIFFGNILTGFVMTIIAIILDQF